MKYDICIVGVGGQGIITICDLITEAATHAGIPANFYPTKGMAQRGGFVKAQVRLGRRIIGPNVPEKGSDLVIAVEVSEALRGVRFIKPGQDFLLFGYVWQPTAVMLGKAKYPSLEQVKKHVRESGGKMHYLDPKKLPLYGGTPVPANIFVLGAAIGHTGLGKVIDPSGMGRIVQNRWKRDSKRNVFAFQAGMEAL